MTTRFGNTENIYSPWHRGWKMRSSEKSWIHWAIACTGKLYLACISTFPTSYKAVFWSHTISSLYWEPRRTCSPLMCLPKPVTARGHQGTSLSQSASCCKLYDFVTRWWLLARYEKKNANFSRKFYFRVHFTVYTEWEMLNSHHVNFQIAYVEQCRCSCLKNVWSQNPAFTSTCLTFIITYMRGSDLS